MSGDAAAWTDEDVVLDPLRDGLGAEIATGCSGLQMRQAELSACQCRMARCAAIGLGR